MCKRSYFRLTSALLLIAAWALLSYLFFQSNNSLTVCLQGVSYKKKDWDITSLACNVLYHTVFALILGTGLWKDREENNEMSLVRYGSYRRYYRTVYQRAVITTLLYDVFSFGGLLAGEMTGTFINGNPAQTQLLADMVSLYLCNHLLWALLITWSIIEKADMRLSFLLYPGIFLSTVLLSVSLPRQVNQWLPGNWMMLYRSDRYQKAGYSRDAVRIGLLAAFILLTGIKWHIKKKNNKRK